MLYTTAFMVGVMEFGMSRGFKTKEKYVRISNKLRNNFGILVGRK